MDLKKPKIAHFYDVKYSKNYGVFLKIFDVRIFVRILAKICGHLCTFWPKYVRFLKKFWCAPFGQLMCAFEFRIIEHSVCDKDDETSVIEDEEEKEKKPWKCLEGSNGWK